jgi:hypothetical protein
MRVRHLEKCQAGGARGMCERVTGGAWARGISCAANPQQAWDTFGTTKELRMIAEKCMTVGAVVVRMSMDRPRECE